jgi:hypothetical protein
MHCLLRLGAGLVARQQGTKSLNIATGSPVDVESTLVDST